LHGEGKLTKSKGLPYWQDKLAHQDMPVLSHIIKELNEMTGSDDASVNQLADVILKDPNLNVLPTACITTLLAVRLIQ